MRTLVHAHKLKRHTYNSGTKVYFCVLNCGFKVEDKLAFGKKVICWRCGREFTMNEMSIRLARPHCLNCTKSKSEHPAVNTEQVTALTSGESVVSLKDRLAALQTVEVGERDEDL